MHNPKSTTNLEGGEFLLNVFLDYGASLPRLCPKFGEKPAPQCLAQTKKGCVHLDTVITVQEVW